MATLSIWTHYYVYMKVASVWCHAVVGRLGCNMTLVCGRMQPFFVKKMLMLANIKPKCINKTET